MIPIPWRASKQSWELTSWCVCKRKCGCKSVRVSVICSGIMYNRLCCFFFWTKVLKRGVVWLIYIYIYIYMRVGVSLLYPQKPTYSKYIYHIWCRKRMENSQTTHPFHECWAGCSSTQQHRGTVCCQMISNIDVNVRGWDWQPVFGISRRIREECAIWELLISVSTGWVSARDMRSYHSSG